MFKKLTLLFVGLISTTTAFAQLPAAKKAATLVLKPGDIKAGVTQGVKQAVTRHVAELRRANVASLREVYQLTNQQIAPTATAGEQVSALLKQMDVYAQMQVRTEQAAREILTQYGTENIPREILRQSAQHGLVDVVPYLMKNGADPSDVLAEYLAYPSIVKDALKWGANMTPELYIKAAENGYLETIHVLYENFPTQEKPVVEMFRGALANNQFGVATMLLPDINLNTHKSSNLLLENIQANRKKQVIWLLEHGADPNIYIETTIGCAAGPLPQKILKEPSYIWRTYLPILKQYGAKVDDLLFRTLDDLGKTKFLVEELGANPQINHGSTPYEKAKLATTWSLGVPWYRLSKFEEVVRYYESLGFGK